MLNQYRTLLQVPQYQSKAFKRLQARWYKKLKDTGFEDAEDTKSERQYMKAWHGSYFQARYTEDEFESKKQYYDRARAFLAEQFGNVPFFVRPTEATIWELHSDGMGYRDIARQLDTKIWRVRLIIIDLSEQMLGTK